MSKAKRKKRRLQQGTNNYGSRTRPVSLPGGDTGPDTAMQRRSKIFEAITFVDERTGEIKKSPNNQRRARRVDMAEGLYMRNKITKRQLNAAKALREAYEQTMLSAPAVKEVQVDTSLRPDHAVERMLERIDVFSKIKKHATVNWGLLAHVCCEDRAIYSFPGCQGSQHAKAMDRLRDGLDVLADGLGY